MTADQDLVQFRKAFLFNAIPPLLALGIGLAEAALATGSGRMAGVLVAAMAGAYLCRRLYMVNRLFLVAVKRRAAAEQAALREEIEKTSEARAAKLSHDLRSPLLALRAVLDSSELPPEQVHLGQAASERLHEIVRGLTMRSAGPSPAMREAFRSLTR